MLTYLSSSIWASPAKIPVNTVNVVGVIGKGIDLKSEGCFDVSENLRKRMLRTNDVAKIVIMGDNICTFCRQYGRETC